MVKTHTQNVLALSVAALVASGVAAFAGVATFNNDLAGKAVNLAQGEMCPGGCPSNQWCDYVTHSCQAFDTSGSSAPPSTGTASTGTAGVSPTTTSTTSGPTGLNCAGGTLAACKATCTKDGVVNTFCMGYCARECPSTSTTATSTSTTVDRCAMYSLNECEALCSCAKDKFSAANSVEKAALWYTDLWSSGGKTYGGCIETCFAKKNAPPPVPVVEEPAVPAAPVAMPVEPVPTQPLVEPAHRAAPDLEDNFEDEDAFGDDDDVDEFDWDSRGGFHGGPGDFDEDFDMEFGLNADDFGNYGYSFDGDFGEDDLGDEMPWMDDVEEDMLRVAESNCPDFVVDIEEAEGDPEILWEIGMDMQEECMGGDMGEGPPDPEMMENAAKMLGIFADKEGPVYFALDVAKKHDVFSDDEVKEIEGILDQIGEKAEEAEEACGDLPDMDEGDFFGLRGLLAQLFDDEDEEEDDGDEEFDEDGDDEDDIGEDMRKKFEACGNVLNKALGTSPGQDEEEMGSGLMGELEGLMREPMEAAVKDGTIPQEEWDEVEDRFNALMEELGFEGEFEDHEFDEDVDDFDEGDEEEGEEESEEEEFSDEDFNF